MKQLATALANAGLGGNVVLDQEEEDLILTGHDYDSTSCSEVRIYLKEPLADSLEAEKWLESRLKTERLMTDSGDGYVSFINYRSPRFRDRRQWISVKCLNDLFAGTVVECLRLIRDWPAGLAVDRITCPGIRG